MSILPAPSPVAPSTLALSVILPVGGQRARAAAALRSVLDQEVGGGLEVLLLDLAADKFPPLPGSDDTRVRILQLPPGCTLAAARAQAVLETRAPVVAFIEEHCEALPGWAEALVEAHRGPWAAVACSFENGNPGCAWSDVAFRLTYDAYTPPNEGRGPILRFVGQNSAFKHSALFRHKERLPELLKSESALQLLLHAEGDQFLYEPSARVAHRNQHSLFSLFRGAFYSNCCLAHMHAEVLHWSVWRRVLRALAMPLVPWVRLVKITTWVAPHGRAALAQLLRDVPVVIVFHYFSAAGQLAGLLFDIEKADRTFSTYEVNEPRLRREEEELVHAS